MVQTTAGTSLAHVTLLLNLVARFQPYGGGFVGAFSPTIAHHQHRHLAKSSALAAVWSDSKAVRDYQDFLSSGKQEIELAKDGPCVIVRSAANDKNDAATLHIVQALYQMGNGDDVVLTPDQPLPETLGNGVSEYPVYLVLPPWEMNDFLQNLPDHTYRERNEDFVFLSGGLSFGNLEDVLKERGYCRESMTQCLISGLLVKPIVGQQQLLLQDLSANLGTDAGGADKFAGECSSCGKWAGAVVERFQRHSIRCQVEFYREWRRRMWERTVFDSVFHLLGAVRSQPTSIREVGMYYEDEVSDMVWELSQLLRGWRALTLTYGFEERMFGMAEKSSSTEGTDLPTQLVPEMYPFLWGNPVFLESQPFSEYLMIAQADRGLLPGIELPQRAVESYKSNMRQGNLRADGVV